MIKLRLFSFCVFVFFPFVCSSFEVTDLYQQARKFNPGLQRLFLEQDFQKAQLGQMKSAFFPQISFQGVYFYGNVPLSREVGRTGLDRIDNQNAINLRTTLYNGGSEYTYFKFKEILPRLAKNQKESGLFEFFLQLSAVFFNFKNLENQQALHEKQVYALRKRVRLLRKWSDIGRVRKADYLSTLTQLRSLEGRLQEIKENLKIAQFNIQNLTGVDLSEKSTEIDFDRFSSVPGNWNRDIASRPQFKLLQSSLANQLQLVKVQEAGRRPRVDLNSNLYVNRRLFGRQDDWDVGVSVSWNLLDFGAVDSQVQQARVRLRQLQADFAMAKRNLSNEIKVVENRFLDQLKRKKILKSSYDIALLNFREHSKEFKKGLIDALELNRAQEQMIQAQIAYQNMRYSLAEQWYALKLMCGEIQL